MDGFDQGELGVEGEGGRRVKWYLEKWPGLAHSSKSVLTGPYPLEC